MTCRMASTEFYSLLDGISPIRRALVPELIRALKLPAGLDESLILQSMLGSPHRVMELLGAYPYNAAQLEAIPDALFG